MCIHNIISYNQAHYSSSEKGLEPSQPCRPINLTPFVKQTTMNRVVVFWDNFGKVHWFF